MRQGKVALGLGVGLLAVFLLGLAGAALMAGADPLALKLEDVLMAPGHVHWLGADDVGRDVLARLAAGVRVSLLVGGCVLVVTAAIGIPLGLLAGWHGGWVDTVVLKLTEAVLSFPGLLMAMA